jgi:hypothetical protein
MSLEGTLDVTVGSGVGFEFVVHNAGSDPVEMQFSDAQTFDVVVERADDGEEAWRFSEGMMFAQMLQEQTLSPGETETFEATWDDPDPGQYRAQGTLAATNVDCSAAVSFTV